MTYLMMRLEWKVFISSKPCRLIVVPRQEFIKHMFGKLLFFFVFPKLGISYKAKKGRSKLLESLALLRPFGDSLFKRSHSLGRKHYSVYTGLVMPPAWWSLLFFRSAGIWAWKRLHKPCRAWRPAPSGCIPGIHLFPSYGFLSPFPVCRGNVFPIFSIHVIKYCPVFISYTVLQ